MFNKDIRDAAKKSGIHLWQIAEAIGVNDGNFSRKLRKEFTPKEKSRILDIINHLSQEQQEVI